MKFTKTSLLFSTAILLGSALTGLTGVAQAADQALLDKDGNPISGVSSGQENGAEVINGDATAGSAAGESTVGIGFRAGNLTLNQVPNFDFGGENDFMAQTDFTLFNEGAELNYTDDSGTAPRPRALIVTDARGADDSGATNGWKVSVNFKTLLTKGDTTLGEAGDATAAPILQLSSAVEPTPVTFDTANHDTIAVGTTVTDSGSPLYTAAPPVLQETGKTNFLDVPSNTTDPTTVVTANATQGLRGWAVNYKAKDSVHLQVPIEQQYIGVFTAKLNWTLGNAPA